MDWAMAYLDGATYFSDALLEAQLSVVPGALPVFVRPGALASPVLPPRRTKLPRWVDGDRNARPDEMKVHHLPLEVSATFSAIDMEATHHRVPTLGLNFLL